MDVASVNHSKCWRWWCWNLGWFHLAAFCHISCQGEVNKVKTKLITHMIWGEGGERTSYVASHYTMPVKSKPYIRLHCKTTSTKNKLHRIELKQQTWYDKVFLGGKSICGHEISHISIYVSLLMFAFFLRSEFHFPRKIGIDIFFCLRYWNVVSFICAMA